VDSVGATPPVTNACAVDQDINTIVFANAFCHGMFNGLRISKIGLIEDKSRKVLGELLGLCANIYTKDRSSTFQEEARCREANTRTAPGDYSNLVLKGSDRHCAGLKLYQ
jgi:hypothetical protein